MSIFNGLFGKAPEEVKEKQEEEIKQSNRDMLKEWQRKLKSEQRDLERQINKIKREEEKVKKEMKQSAAKGDKAAVKILAKNLVQSHKAVDRLYMTKAQMFTVCNQLNQMGMQVKMADTMKQSVEIMHGMNQIVKAPEVMATMAQMQKEMAKAGLIEEVFDEALDDALGSDVEEDADAEVAKIYDELALTTLMADTTVSKASIAKAPAAGAKAAAPAAASKEEEDLNARMAELMH